MAVSNASSSASRDPAAIARELNKFVTQSGGQAIQNLDKLDPQQLIKLRDGLKQFLDRFDDAAKSDPGLAQVADGEAVKSLRSLAQIASQRVDQAAVQNGNANTARAASTATAPKKQMSGFCGGCPAPPPPPPPAQDARPPEAPPPPARGPEANAGRPSGNNAAATPSTPQATTQSTGTATPVTTSPTPAPAQQAGSRMLSQDELAQMGAQVAQLKRQVADSRALVQQQKVQVQADIRALEAKGSSRTPAEEGLLQGKRAQLSVLGGYEQNLQLKSEGLDAAKVAISDGVLTRSEATDLKNIQNVVMNKDQLLSRMAAQADQLVQRMTPMAAGFAANGSNFDPFSLNQLSPAVLLSSAMQTNGLQGVANLGGNVGNLAALTNPLGAANIFQNPAQNLPGMAQGQSFLGNVASSALGNLAGNVLGNIAGNVLGGVFQPPGSLSAPLGIGDDNIFGPGGDASLSALKSAGGGGGYFEDKVFAVMCKIVEDMQKKIEERLEKLQQEAKDAEQGGGGGGGGGKGGGIGGLVGGIAGTMIGGPVGGMIGKAAGGAIGGAIGGGGGSGGAGGGGQSSAESRNIEFEKIKYDMQKLSQMQQAMSNVLNSMDELAKSAIHHIKAG